MRAKIVFPFLCAVLFLLSTVLFCKMPAVFLLTVTSVVLWRIVNAQNFAALSYQPLVWWSVVTVILAVHTICVSEDFWHCALATLRMSSVFLQTALLQVALLQMRLQESPQMHFSKQTTATDASQNLMMVGSKSVSQGLTQSFSQIPPQGLFWILIAGFLGLSFQFWTNGNLTFFFNKCLAYFSLPLFKIPLTFKPHLSVLSLSFFLFLGVCMNQKRWQNTPGSQPPWLGRWGAPILFGLGLLGLSIWMQAQTVFLALLVGSCVFVASFYWPQLVFYTMSSTMGLILLGLPWLIKLFYSDALIHKSFFQGTLHTLQLRLLHWHDLLPFIWEKPFWGHGLGYGRVISQISHLSIPLTFPHNMVFELWLDLGLMGVCLLTSALFLFLRHLARQTNPVTRSTGMAYVAFIFIMNQTGYSNLHIWWLSSLCLVSFFTPLLLRKTDIREE